MNAQEVSNSLHAFARLPAAAACVSDLGNDALEEAAETLAPRMNEEERRMTLWACRTLGARVPSALYVEEEEEEEGGGGEESAPLNESL